MRLFIFFSFLSIFCNAQIESLISIPLLGINVSGQIPLFDMANRFGPNLNTGGTFMFKTKKNWLFGIESNYIFGTEIKEDVLKQLKNEIGNVTNNLGYPADIRVTERGFGVHLLTGKVFKTSEKNPNSGILVTFGIGYLQHKINIYDSEQKIAAVQGELVYGYDRLTAGFSLTQFIGYLFLSKNRLLNFYFGFENYQAFTKSIRKLNYDTGSLDEKQRLDALSGFRFGWVLPLYKKKPNDFYYY